VLDNECFYLVSAPGLNIYTLVLSEDNYIDKYWQELGGRYPCQEEHMKDKDQLEVL
jgi:hypothetical protein